MATFQLNSKTGTDRNGEQFADWQLTSFDLLADRPVIVHATGKVRNYFREPYRGPEGTGHVTPGAPVNKFTPLVQELSHLGVIGRGGVSGTPFLIGDEIPLMNPQAGDLYVAYNDSLTYDNDGTFDITVENMPATSLQLDSQHGSNDRSTWKSTGIQITSGQMVRIIVKGTASCNASYGKADARGAVANGISVSDNNPLVPSLPLHAVIAQIGGDGAFSVGNDLTFTASRSGLLELAYNDSVSSDNNGTFDIEVFIA